MQIINLIFSSELSYSGTWLMFAGVMLQMIVGGTPIRLMERNTSKKQNENQKIERSKERENENIQKQNRVLNLDVQHPEVSNENNRKNSL